MEDEAEEGRVVHVGTLYLPHYWIELEPGAAVVSERRGDCWVVRFVYDPVDYPWVAILERVRELNELVPNYFECDRLTDEPFHVPEEPDIKPPLVAAFGDAGESRASVEAAFFEQICSEWCSIVRRAHGEHEQEDVDAHALGHADVWCATGATMDRDLLNMFASAETRSTRFAGHRGGFVLKELRREYFESARLDPFRGKSEREYFRAQIKKWRVRELEHTFTGNIFTR